MAMRLFHAESSLYEYKLSKIFKRLPDTKFPALEKHLLKLLENDFQWKLETYTKEETIYLIKKKCKDCVDMLDTFKGLAGLKEEEVVKEDIAIGVSIDEEILFFRTSVNGVRKIQSSAEDIEKAICNLFISECFFDTFLSELIESTPFLKANLKLRPRFYSEDAVKRMPQQKVRK